MKETKSNKSKSKVYIDNETNIEYILSQNQLFNFLNDLTPQISVSFDKYYSDELSFMDKNINLILNKIALGKIKAAKQDAELFTVLGNLLKNGLDTTLCSIQLLRNGMALQSSILLRTVSEIGSVVTYLRMTPEDLGKFKLGKLKSSKLISKSEKIIPIFRKIWDGASNKIIHINYNFHAMNYPICTIKNNESIPINSTLISIGYNIMLLHIITELAFIDFFEEAIFWKKQPVGNYKFLSAAINERYSWLTEINDRLEF